MDVDGMDHGRHHFFLKRFKFKFVRLLTLAKENLKFIGRTSQRLTKIIFLGFVFHFFFVISTEKLAVVSEVVQQ